MKSFRPLRGAPLLTLLLAFFSAACSGAPRRVLSGGDMPDIPVVHVSGATDTLDSLRRGHASLVVFWATWCGPCRAEVPRINQLAERYAAQDFVVLGVAMGEPLNVVKAGATDLGIKYPVVVAPDMSYLDAIGIRRVPTLVLVDAGGRILMVEHDLTEALRARIDQITTARAATRGGSERVSASVSSSGSLGGLAHPALWVWFVGAVLCIPFYYSLIIVHSCCHNTFTRSKQINRWVGEILSFVNLFRFQDFRALHLLHHARTNQPGRDPHYIRPGGSRPYYALTQYFQLVAFTYSVYYRTKMWPQHWKGVDMNSPSLRRQDRLGKVLIISGRRTYGLGSILVNNIVTLLLTVFLATWYAGGLSALKYPVALWLLPWGLSQILIADFNYRGHVGLLEKGAQYPYQGEDTRNLDTRFGYFLNVVTFGFYRHRDHHRWPAKF